jgi:ubiquinone/menaquinone biosynthesis C-methylase UbiE
MNQSITDAVRTKYGAVAASTLTNDHPGVQAVAEAFGYSAEELSSIPAEANMGLSCGNPTATAHLKPGEVVVDLGSGGGLDVFLAAKKVGPTGKAIGIDMTPEMVQRARANAAKQGLGTVEFHLATIDRLPLSGNSVDCVISNCVINLAPDKPAVFREIFRVLKPGGRVAISDIALKRHLPPEVGSDLLAYVGCIAGAIPIAEYIASLKAAGFSAVQVVDTKKNLNAYSAVEGPRGCCSPATEPTAPAESCYIPAPKGSSACCTSNPTPAASGSAECGTPHPPPESKSVHGGLAELLAKYDVNDYAASVQVYAVKPL